MKILLVEDTEQLNKALTTVLRRNSYVVDSAFDGEEALIFIDQYQYDLIILDIMLPKVNGLEVLKRIRSSNNQTPVLLLTAKSTTEDKITGLDLGADDYLAKPFVIDELLARIRALLRRTPQMNEETILSFGDLRLDVQNSVLSSGEEKVTLMNKELQIMSILMKSGAKIVSLDTITKNAWDIEAYTTSENVWVFISYIRKKLESIHSKTKIKSIRYQGYYLEYKND
jgi:DNA-binding response OmpR family regulator